MKFKIFSKEIELGKTTITAIVAVIALTMGLIGYISSKEPAIVINKDSKDLALPKVCIESKEENLERETGNVEGTIKVHVAGAVCLPGVVTLKKGQIIEDAIKAAGGASENADLNKINLAYELTENAKIVVASVDDKNIAQAKVVTDSECTVITNNGEDKNKVKKVNINKATVGELNVLPGIGESTAKKIISYRNKHGEFKTIQDLKKVSGIGDSKYNSIAGMISVS